MPSTPFKGYALIDCNNFYVSCERIFKPYLNQVPVAVLSNNDGCIIARSQEVKDLKIPMGAPVFLYKDVIQRNNIQLFSSNFELYGDISERVMQIIADFCPDIEIYSIDEAFVPITDQTEEDFFKLRQRILKWVGIPVSIGMGPSKTLAKAANASAKKRRHSVLSLFCEHKREALLSTFPIEDVWGIGRRISKRLQACKIFTAKAYRDAPEEWTRRQFKLPGLRTALELKGLSCQQEEENSLRKSLMYSKSFGRPVRELNELKEAVCHYAAEAAYKIRRKGYLAQSFTLYLKQRERSWVKTITLSYPSDDTSHYIQVAKALLEKSYQKGFYVKAGIYLSSLTLKSENQMHFFQPDRTQSDKISKTLDQVNKRYGRNTLYFAGQGLQKKWIYKRDHKTPYYTGRWEQTLQIQI